MLKLPSADDMTSASNNGTLSMNLGGTQLTYNLGPSTSVVAGQAMNYLKNSFANDMAFTGGAIFGANQLVSGMTMPLITAAQNEANFNNSQLPGFYNTLASQNFTLGQQSVGASTAIANASIAASRASAQAASNAGGCYITSAVCESFDLPDDCSILTAFRSFRDRYMLATPQRRELLARYYRDAPGIVSRIKQRTDSRKYLRSIFDRYLVPALEAINREDDTETFLHYVVMLRDIKKENLR